MIPKLIHRIWLGPKPIPAAYENYWRAWQRQHPDYTFRTWRDSDIDESFFTRKKVAEAKGMSVKADIAGYEILYKHGGVYLDCDVMPYHYLDWQKLNSDFVVCNEAESGEFCSRGVFACAPSSDILKRAVDTLAGMPLNVLPPNVETGPFFFRRMLAFGFYTMLPKDAFYPYAFNEPFASILGKDLSGTYGIHVWKGSWIKEEEMLQNILDRLRWGDLSEAVSLANEIKPEAGKLIADYAEVVRKARVSCIVATGNAILSKYLKIRSTIHFEFLKCAFHLLEKEKNTIIWQIGAADGILADPLRPLAVNFDPKIVMLEPNPYMFERLQRNYARNENIRFIQAALGSACGKMELHAVHPDKIAAEHVEKIPVEMISVAKLMTITDNQKPDIVLVDVEGMDGKILQSILESGIRPKIIQYETRCLPESDKEALAAKLGKEYVQISFGNDLVAYRTDFFLAYCNELYITHGIPTIYEEALKFIVKS